MLVFINYWIEKCTVKHWNSNCQCSLLKKIQLSGTSAYPDGSPFKLIRVSGVLLCNVAKDRTKHLPNKTRTAQDRTSLPWHCYENYPWSPTKIWSICLLIFRRYIRPTILLWAGIARSVQRLATGWTVRGSNPGGGEIFRTHPHRPWSPPSLLYNGFRVFRWGKAAGA